MRIAIIRTQAPPKRDANVLCAGLCGDARAVRTAAL